MEPEGRELVETYLGAMQRGPQGEDALVGLFAEDGVYVQALWPGTPPRTYAGRDAIRRALREGLRWNPPGFRIRLDRLEVEGDELVAWWTYTSERLPQPVHGVDRYTLHGGRIKRLETRLR